MNGSESAHLWFYFGASNPESTLFCASPYSFVCASLQIMVVKLYSFHGYLIIMMLALAFEVSLCVSVVYI